MMLKVQLPGSESTQFSVVLPRPFLSGNGTSATLAFLPRPALFHKHKSCSIHCRLPLVTNTPVPKTTTTKLPFNRKSFPPDFYFGTASSAYQYEGSPFADGKTASIWDHFTHTYPDDFRDYAEVCFEKFGDRVKFWATLNEPYTFTTGGYVQGNYPPAKTDNTGTDPYIVAHHLLLSHAAAVGIYRDKYQATQNGNIGIVLNPFWMVPYSNSPEDVAAAERSLDFSFGWFMEPITSGKYPQVMEDLVGPRLPRFYINESELLKGSYDFLGVNYYTSNYAQDAPPSEFPPENPSYDTDSYCTVQTSRHGIPIGAPTASPWLHVCPEGLRDILLYIKEKYNNPSMYITENGISQDSTLPKEVVLKDHDRTRSLSEHLKYLLAAMKEGADVKGFFIWTLYDDFEWNVGFTVRFGINYVDFEKGLKREPKESALWFQKFLLAD